MMIVKTSTQGSIFLRKEIDIIQVLRKQKKKIQKKNNNQKRFIRLFFPLKHNL